MIDLCTRRILLQLVPAPLGSAMEQPCGIERAQLLGHAINNRLAVAKAGTGLRRREPLTDIQPP